MRPDDVEGWAVWSGSVHDALALTRATQSKYGQVLTQIWGRIFR